MKHLARKLNKKITTLIWHFILLCLLIGQVALPGALLCIGADGHVEFESSSASRIRCGSPSKATQQQTSDLLSGSGIYSDKSHCGPCADISFSIGSSEKSISPAQDLTPELKISKFVSFLISLPVFVGTSAEGFLPQPPTAVSSTAASLQTTVLLC